VGKLLADETRRKILRILGHEEMTLIGAKLIHITRQEQVRNMIQPYYKAVSRDFYVSYRVTEALEEDPDYSVWTDGYLERLIEGLEMYGVTFSVEEKPRVKQLLLKCHIINKKAYEERVQRKIKEKDIGRYAQRSIAHIVAHLQLLDNTEYNNTLEELKKIIETYTGSTWNVQ
jgi:DNA-binding transcriptional ArsR family regulator